MSKYLNLFKTKAEADAAVYDENNTPNVSYCEENESVKYTEKIVPPPPLESTFVDLGLPSGLKWAKANLGAEEETDPGLYYMWGDTEGHAKDSGYEFTSANYNAKGLNTISTDLTLAQDAANVRLSGDWRMPTNSELSELIYNTNTSWTTINGVAGRKFVSKTDASKYIFIPAAGSYWSSNLSNWGTCGYVWQTKKGTGGMGTSHLQFGEGFCNVAGIFERYYGLPIRAVCSK